ncbi:MAG: WecB/TagA/CpsF family glycosyltransferase [Ignavibacteriaceae bacterium]
MFYRYKKKVYIIGGNFSEIQIQRTVTKGLIICSYKNGFFKSDEDAEIIYDIKKNNPDVIIIGMGVPKQEFFAGKLMQNINGKEIICVGNFLEFYFGNVKRIPKTFRNLGIEWCYRLLTEPKRLWNRYIFGIPIFMKSVIKLKIKS